MKLTIVCLIAAGFSAMVVVAFTTRTALCQSKAPVETRRNIPYAETDNPRQQLDLYLPQQRGEKLLPVVAFIHGGGWQTGGKGNGRFRS